MESQDTPLSQSENSIHDAPSTQIEILEAKVALTAEARTIKIAICVPSPTLRTPASALSVSVSISSSLATSAYSANCSSSSTVLKKHWQSMAAT